jgi:hypothetical protein
LLDVVAIKLVPVHATEVETLVIVLEISSKDVLVNPADDVELRIKLVTVGTIKAENVVLVEVACAAVLLVVILLGPLLLLVIELVTTSEELQLELTTGVAAVAVVGLLDATLEVEDSAPALVTKLMPGDKNGHELGVSAEVEDVSAFKVLDVGTELNTGGELGTSEELDGVELNGVELD